MYKCSTCDVREMCSLRALTSCEIESVSQNKIFKQIDKGEDIFQEGDFVNGIYCIKEGFCKLTKNNSNGKSQIIKFVTRGVLLGQRSVIGGEAEYLSATAVTDMLICFIPKEEIIEPFKHNKNFTLDVIKSFCEELKESDKVVLDITQKTIRQRLASALLYMDETFGVDEKGFISVQLSREEIANSIGAATESLIRMLSEFSKNNIVETRGKQLRLVNKAQLKELSG